MRALLFVAGTLALESLPFWIVFPQIWRQKGGGR
jgi:hypothetical protein